MTHTRICQENNHAKTWNTMTSWMLYGYDEERGLSKLVLEKGNEKEI